MEGGQRLSRERGLQFKWIDQENPGEKWILSHVLGEVGSRSCGSPGEEQQRDQCKGQGGRLGNELEEERRASCGQSKVSKDEVGSERECGGEETVKGGLPLYRDGSVKFCMTHSLCCSC
jgi:hypothetical protein